MSERCEFVTIMEDGIPDGWVVICCDEHDPLMSTWDTADDAMAALSESLGVSDWWEEEPGIWMAEVPHA